MTWSDLVLPVLPVNLVCFLSISATIRTCRESQCLPYVGFPPHFWQFPYQSNFRDLLTLKRLQKNSVQHCWHVNNVFLPLQQPSLRAPKQARDIVWWMEIYVHNDCNSGYIFFLLLYYSVSRVLVQGYLSVSWKCLCFPS